MSITTASETITMLRQLSSCYGLPEQLVSDNVPQFTTDEFANFMKSMVLSLSIALRTIPHPGFLRNLIASLTLTCIHDLKLYLNWNLIRVNSSPSRYYTCMYPYWRSLYIHAVLPGDLMLP